MLVQQAVNRATLYSCPSLGSAILMASVALSVLGKNAIIPIVASNKNFFIFSPL
nr:MAG TPA: hypothetical protein [Caudoviricetes sp.]